MTVPTDEWELRVLHYLFGSRLLLNIQTATHLYKEDKAPALQPVRDELTSTFSFNAAMGLATAVASTALLQRFFPSYGRSFGLLNTVLDAGILMLFMGGSALYSLQEMEGRLEQVRRGWIVGQEKGYLKRMQQISRLHGIPLLTQVEPFLSPEQRLPWKAAFDSLIF